VRNLDPAMLQVVGISGLAMLGVFLFLLMVRAGLENVETELDALRHERVR